MPRPKLQKRNKRNVKNVLLKINQNKHFEVLTFEIIKETSRNLRKNKNETLEMFR